MKRIILLFISIFSAFLSAYADKKSDLMANEWLIDNIECKVVAKTPSKQAFVDSCLAYINRPSFSYKDAFSYKFTENEMILKKKNKNKDKEETFSYKLDGDKLLVDLGGGKVYILDCTLSKDNLILSLDGSLFFQSDYAPKNVDLENDVSSLSVVFTFVMK